MLSPCLGDGKSQRSILFFDLALVSILSTVERDVDTRDRVGHQDHKPGAKRQGFYGFLGFQNRKRAPLPSRIYDRHLI